MGRFGNTEPYTEKTMDKTNQTKCTADMNRASDQCAEYLNNQHREILYGMGGVIAIGVAAIAYYLYTAVLKVSFIGAVPF